MCPHLAAVPAGHHELFAGAARGEVRVDARRVEEATLTGGVPLHGLELPHRNLVVTLTSTGQDTAENYRYDSTIIQIS